MANMTDSDRDKMREHLASLLDRAKSTDPDRALTNEAPLSVERSGKYVNVLFSTGGPHTELTAEFSDEEEAEYWFENEPQGAWFTYMDWGTREDVYIGRSDAYSILAAIIRDPDELDEEVRRVTISQKPAKARPGGSVPGRAAVPLQQRPVSHFGTSSGALGRRLETQVCESGPTTKSCSARSWSIGCSTSTDRACAAWATDFYDHKPSAGELAW